MIELYECKKCKCKFMHEVGSKFDKVCDNCGSRNVKLLASGKEIKKYL